MNAQQRRKQERDREAEVDRRIEERVIADRERHEAEMQELRLSHAAAIAAEVEEHRSLINDNTRLRCEVESMQFELARAQADLDEVRHDLQGTEAALATANRRLSELARENDRLKSEDRDAARLRRRLARKTEEVRQARAAERKARAQAAESRRERPFA